MGEVLRRWRVAIVLVGSVCALIAIAVIALAPTRSAAPAAASVATTTSAPPPPLTVASAASAAKPSSTTIPSAKASASSAFPVPEKIDGITATFDPSFGDPFESKAGRPGDVRELVRVGDVRLGVTNASKVKDERALVGVLRELGAEIDAKDRGRKDDIERRMLDYQPIYEKYRSKLEPYLDGAFALKGHDGWTDTEPVRWPSNDAGAAHDAP